MSNPANPKSNRRSPFRLTRWIITLIIIAILWCIWTVYSIMYAKPTISVDYGQQLLDLVASHQPPGEDAWEDFNEAVTVFNEVSREMVEEASAKMDEFLADQTCEVPTFPTDDQDDKADDAYYQYLYRDYSRIYNGPHDPDRYTIELEEIRRLKERGAFEAIHRAVSKPRMIAPPGKTDPEWGDALMFSILSIQGHVSEFSQAMTCRMRLAFVDERFDEHAHMFDDSLGTAQFLAVQLIPIYYQIAARSAEYPLRELRYELMEGGFSPDHCRRLLSILDKRTQWYNTFDRAIEVDRLMILDAIQRWYTDGLFGSGYIILTNIPDSASSSIPGLTELSPVDDPTFADRIINLRALTLPRRREMTKAAKRWSDTWVDLVQKTPINQQSQYEEIDALADQLSGNNEVIGMLMADYRSVIKGLNSGHVHIAATRIMLGLDWYRGTHGSYPASLDALVPEFFDKMPTDPLNGLPFGYRRLDDPTQEDPVHNRPYLIYSFGLDGIDNDGQMLPGGEKRWEARRPGWPLVGGVDDGHIGYDYIINQPRPPYTE